MERDADDVDYYRLIASVDATHSMQSHERKRHAYRDKDTDVPQEDTRRSRHRKRQKLYDVITRMMDEGISASDLDAVCEDRDYCNRMSSKGLMSIADFERAFTRKKIGVQRCARTGPRCTSALTCPPTGTPSSSS
jgi:hypothetical protein